MAYELYKNFSGLLATASEMQYIMWVSRVTCSTDTGLSQHVVLLWIIT